MGSANSRVADYDAPAYAVMIILLVLTTVAVVARAVSRHLTHAEFGVDDGLCYVGFVANAASLVNQLTTVTSGAYDLQRLIKFTPEQASSYSKQNVATAVLYVVTITCVKLSVLFLYKRIFGHFQTWFKMFWWFNFVVIFPAWAFATLGVLIWLQVQTFAFTNAGNVYGSASVTLVNALSDIMVLIMPISGVLKLQLSWSKKLGVIAVFALGLLTTAISLARCIVNFTQLSITTNPAYLSYLFTILSLTESSAATLCACIPVARPFFFEIAKVANTSSLRNLVTRFSSSSAGSRSSLGHSSMGESKGKDTISRTVAVDVESLPLHETNSGRESLKHSSVGGFDRQASVTKISA